MIRAVAVLGVLIAHGEALAASAGLGSLSSGASQVRGAFLLRGVGARPVGMGEAYTAVADDASAVSWNPGGLGQVDSLNALAMYDTVGEGVGLRYAAAAMPVPSGVAGVAITAMSYGSYEKFDALGNRVGVEGLLDVGVTASYGIEHPAWLGVGGGSGVAVEWVRETVGDTLLGVSAGTVVPVGADTTAGAALLHLGAKKNGASLPAVVRIGGAERLPWRLRAAADVSAGLVDSQRWIGGGGEWSPNARVALRLGWRQRIDPGGGAGTSGVTAGVGMLLSGFAVDYAYQPEGNLGTSHRVSVSYGRRAAGED